MKVLYTCFNGINNSSKVLLDCIDASSNDKLYLKNSFNTSVEQLKNKINENKYDLIVSFGQAPLEKNTIKIETKATSYSDYYETDYEYTLLKEKIKQENYDVIISKDAGKYLCNNIYYNGLKYIKGNHLKCKMIFIHIPKLNNIKNVEELASVFKHAIFIME